MFRDEMSAQAKPSLDGMAQEVLAKGRRARRARTAMIGSAALVAAGLGVVAVALPSIGGTHSVAIDRSVAAVILTDVKSPATYIKQPAGPKAPTSSAAVLDELLKLLPPGATSNYESSELTAQTYLDGARGLGMIRLFLIKGSLNPQACAGPSPSDMTRTCSTLPSGATVVTTNISDNCVEPLAIDVDHGDGTVVQIDVATCLAWNGTSNPPTNMAITPAQALAIAANPAWGAVQMDAGLVHSAATRFAGVTGATHASTATHASATTSTSGTTSASGTPRASAATRASAAG